MMKHGFYCEEREYCMDQEYRIEVVERSELSDAWGVIGEALTGFNHQQAGDDNAQTLCYLVRSRDSTIAGGVVAQIYWNWLYIDLMWVREDLRGRGYGHQLLTLVEEDARRRGAAHAFLDTFSFQAPGFYQKHGYRVFGQLADFPAGQQRFFMTKALTE